MASCDRCGIELRIAATDARIDALTASSPTREPVAEADEIVFLVTATTVTF